MINIWAYNPGDKIRVVDIDDVVFEGIVIDITDVGERSDLEKQEDGIGLDTLDGRHIEFYQSEIKNIELIAQSPQSGSSRAVV